MSERKKKISRQILKKTLLMGVKSGGDHVLIDQGTSSEMRKLMKKGDEGHNAYAFVYTVPAVRRNKLQSYNVRTATQYRKLRAARLKKNAEAVKAATPEDPTPETPPVDPSADPPPVDPTADPPPVDPTADPPPEDLLPGVESAAGDPESPEEEPPEEGGEDE